jgi:galactose mutarotase-like enzyme
MNTMDATLAATSWGPWPALRLEDDTLGVTLVPAAGGRVVSLRDRRTGREWLTQGVPPDAPTLGRWAAENAVYGGRESFGWDECLPTVTRGADPLEPAARPLRDHGDQWGRVCDVTLDPGTPSVTTSWPSPRWPMTLERRLSLPGDGTLRAEYSLASHSPRPLPVLWSAHPALRLEPGSRIELPGVTDVRVVGALGWPVPTGERVPWPEPVPGLDLSVVRPIGARGAVKLYAATTLARARTPDGSTLTIEADGVLVGTMGVWLDAGGWPRDGAPIHQTAFEPTSSPDDDVGAAWARGRAWVLPSGGTLRWWMRLRLAAGQEPGAPANA